MVNATTLKSSLAITYPMVKANLFLNKMLHHVFEVNDFLVMKMAHLRCKHKLRSNHCK